MTKTSRRPLRTSSADAPSDADLLRHVAEGDPIALGRLYDRYALDVWRVARRVLGDGADADDVVHAAFLDLRRIAGAFDGRTSCRNWLRGIAVRLALRQRRGKGRFHRMLESLGQTMVRRGVRRNPEREASDNEELRILQRAIARLQPKQRAAFVLVELEEMTSEEAAKALDVPAGTVRTRLFKARRALRAALDPARFK